MTKLIIIKTGDFDKGLRLMSHISKKISAENIIIKQSEDIEKSCKRYIYPLSYGRNIIVLVPEKGYVLEGTLKYFSNKIIENKIEVSYFEIMLRCRKPLFLVFNDKCTLQLKAQKSVQEATFNLDIASYCLNTLTDCRIKYLGEV